MINKEELLDFCQTCSNRLGIGCIIGDIEASREDFIKMPGCMIKSQANNRPPMRNRPATNEELAIKTSNKISNSNDRPPTNENMWPPQYSKVKINLDELDKSILELANQQYHTRAMAKLLKPARSTIQNRLDRMESAGYITSYKGTSGTKLYRISEKIKSLLIYNEESAPVAAFTAHSMTFKFPILEGTQPKSSQGQKMQNWTSYIFKFPDHTIRTTPKHVIVFVNQDLGAASIDDLNLKYSQLAQSYAYKFAEKYHITLGGISKYREGHFTLENNSLAQIISERGEFRTSGGIQIDKSRSSGDLEMKEQTAKAFEFTINKLPVIAAELQTEIKSLKSIPEKVADLDNHILDLQKWLLLERENEKLLQKNNILEQSLTEISKEIQDIKSKLSVDNLEIRGMYV